MQNTKRKHFNILGVKISSIDMDEARETIKEAVIHRKKSYICVCPVSTVVECQRNQKMLVGVNSATLATPDGMPIVWLGRMKGHRDIRRVYGPDLMLEVCRLSEEKGYKNYFYGSSEQVLNKLQAKMKAIFPRLIINGAYSPAFGKISETEIEKNIQMINNSNSDILWVGLGSPKQEIWMYDYRDKINTPVMIGVGAAFDFIAGTKKQAPRLLQKAGLEWLFRLITEPKRLWKRYIIGNPLFLYLICKEFMRSRYGRKGDS